MKKIWKFAGVITFSVIAIVYVISGFFDPLGQQILAHITGAITLLLLVSSCLISGYSYSQEHNWCTFLIFMGGGFLSVAYFMYIFLYITPANSMALSRMFDTGTSMYTLGGIGFVGQLIRKKLLDKKKRK